MTDMQTCPRCGGSFRRHGLRQHQAVCNRLPPPAELLQEVKRTGITNASRLYGVSDYAIRNRIKLAGYEPLPTYKPAVTDPACTSCGILLSCAEARPVRDGLCGVCAGERARHIPPMTLEQACDVVRAAASPA